jgi:hypothetical protein
VLVAEVHQVASAGGQPARVVKERHADHLVRIERRVDGVELLVDEPALLQIAARAPGRKEDNARAERSGGLGGPQLNAADTGLSTTLDHNSTEPVYSCLM